MKPSDLEERHSPLLRSAKFTSIVVVLGVVGGVVLATLGYWDLFTPRQQWRPSNDEFVRRDTVSAMKRRFVIGAAAGGFAGLIYVVRCLRRREDP